MTWQNKYLHCETQEIITVKIQQILKIGLKVEDTCIGVLKFYNFFEFFHLGIKGLHLGIKGSSAILRITI